MGWFEVVDDMKEDEKVMEELNFSNIRRDSKKVIMFLWRHLDDVILIGLLALMVYYHQVRIDMCNAYYQEMLSNMSYIVN